MPYEALICSGLWVEGEFLLVLPHLTGWPVFEWWAAQLKHVPWHGFTFEDMIFPLFLFIAGISFPFSMSKRIASNDSRKSIYKHVISRGLILVLLGIIYNNSVNFDFANLRYGSVLGRIGLAWMFAALIFINTKLKLPYYMVLGYTDKLLALIGILSCS